MIGQIGRDLFGTQQINAERQADGRRRHSEHNVMHESKIQDRNNDVGKIEIDEGFFAGIGQAEGNDQAADRTSQDQQVEGGKRPCIEVWISELSDEGHQIKNAENAPDVEPGRCFFTGVEGRNGRRRDRNSEGSARVLGGISSGSGSVRVRSGDRSWVRRGSCWDRSLGNRLAAGRTKRAVIINKGSAIFAIHETTPFSSTIIAT